MVKLSQIKLGNFLVHKKSSLCVVVDIQKGNNGLIVGIDMNNNIMSGDYTQWYNVSDYKEGLVSLINNASCNIDKLSNFILNHSKN